MDKYVISVNPGIVEPKGGTRRYSTGGMIVRGSVSPSNGDEKSLPHYLRAPKSSCHDYCKYGRTHDFEAKTKEPVLHKLGKKSHHEDSYQMNYSNSEGRRKSPAIKMKSSSQVKPKVTKQKALPQLKESRLVEEPVSLSLQCPSASHKSNTAVDQVTLSRSLENEQIKNSVINKKSEPKISSHTKDLCHKPKFADQHPSPVYENEAHPIVAKILKKTPTRSKTKPVMHQRFKQRPLVPSKVVDTSLKPAKPLKTNKTPAARLESPLTASLGLNDSRNEGCKVSNSQGKMKMVEKKILKPQVPSLSAKPADDGVLSLKSRTYRHRKKQTIMKNQETGMAKPDKENDEEKAIYVIEAKAESVGSDGSQLILPNVENVNFVTTTQESWKPENDNLDSVQHNSPKSKCVDLYFPEQKSPKAETVDLNCLHQILKDDRSSQSVSSDKEDTEESESSCTESTGSESETEEIKSSSDSKSLMSEMRPKQPPSFDPEDNHSLPYKLRFRRGKVIESQPESNGPRRLTFRRGRVVAVNGNGGHVRRKSFRRIVIDDEALKDPDHEAPTIVLRHQDMQEKKDAQGLFNNVIKETASKLVESRKSKVKALVGAFETVISLQDKKPASAI
ncbi:unnamed protein product [Musa acuminata subsp. malaccensis]|uniref:(wild Malaysian banana) hypothetical protein n=1 Tax=Musa acuminata subsp. malaccensis TaxID=214687 RepID=A0A804K0R6_MUSAM|nr:PREDICTED: muscle M-line assembly protein unc-89 [Musa acuminata subsp. malaccensis]XP_009411097.1 PREDICTED: muscle M-line assembly protein unc-89 [Musa acuminata subsp. malaccensis]XP_009411100.1 PREDICTED: muscle M-line assembly protein unc-89 [Musa acuminata subsp. malaccensis]XP_018684945.1 PREDICTED: muscle M-line assembly protein unc-89 [Musa acuminata subsp. malaccensis]XP_018684946.1 PREDICTED: muscle M-line assembly protein unc-89 [Musa acuminata subsp. malaccensis]CAG1857989.1 un